MFFTDTGARAPRSRRKRSYGQSRPGHRAAAGAELLLRPSCVTIIRSAVSPSQDRELRSSSRLVISTSSCQPLFVPAHQSPSSSIHSTHIMPSLTGRFRGGHSLSPSHSRSRSPSSASSFFDIYSEQPQRLTMRCSERLRASRHLLPPPPFRPPCRCRAALRRR